METTTDLFKKEDLFGHAAYTTNTCDTRKTWQEKRAFILLTFRELVVYQNAKETQERGLYSLLFVEPMTTGLQLREGQCGL